MAENVHEAARKGAGRRNKHLVFSLGDLLFGIPLSQVKEIIGIMNITTIPDAPRFFRGIINLRGKVISVIDLKTKLSLPNTVGDSKRPCVVICEFGNTTLGSVVDDVLEVRGYEEQEMEHCMDIQECMSRDYITGVAKTERGMVLLLDLGKVLKIDELKMVTNSAEISKAA